MRIVHKSNALDRGPRNHILRPTRRPTRRTPTTTRTRHDITTVYTVRVDVTTQGTRCDCSCTVCSRARPFFTQIRMHMSSHPKKMPPGVDDAFGSRRMACPSFEQWYLPCSVPDPAAGMSAETCWRGGDGRRTS